MTKIWRQVVHEQIYIYQEVVDLLDYKVFNIGEEGDIYEKGV